jgi:hypothetical protein
MSIFRDQIQSRWTETGRVVDLRHLCDRNDWPALSAGLALEWYHQARGCSTQGKDPQGPDREGGGSAERRERCAEGDQDASSTSQQRGGDTEEAADGAQHKHPSGLCCQEEIDVLKVYYNERESKSRTQIR